MNILSHISDDSRTSILHGVPIQYKDEILRRFRIDGIKIKVRYRGPRAHNKHRTKFTNRGSCLKSDAVRFAVYHR